MSKILAVEIGFGDVKIVGDGISFKFPTVVAYAGNGVLRDWKEENKTYLFGRKKYLVGSDALGHPEMFSSRDPEYIFEFTPLFLYKAFQEADIRPDTLALGLALGYYSRKDKLARRVLSFEINGEKMEILNCSVFPQSVGIWFDWSRDNIQRIHGNYMILDIGFNTVDVVFVKEGKVSKEGSWMLEAEGLIKVVNHLADLIQQKVGIGLIPHTAKSLLEKRSLVIYRKEIDLERIITRLNADYTERLFSILEARCGEQFKNLDGIILGGGGAYYVRDFIPRRLRNLVEVVEEPEFANARGFYKTLKEKGAENERGEDNN